MFSLVDEKSNTSSCYLEKDTEGSSFSAFLLTLGILYALLPAHSYSTECEIVSQNSFHHSPQ